MVGKTDKGKDDAFEQAIARITRWERNYDRSLTAQINRIGRAMAKQKRRPGRPSTLSKEQRDRVIALREQGKTGREIADLLNLKVEFVTGLLQRLIRQGTLKSRGSVGRMEKK